MHTGHEARGQRGTATLPLTCPAGGTVPGRRPSGRRCHETSRAYSCSPRIFERNSGGGVKRMPSRLFRASSLGASPRFLMFLVENRFVRSMPGRLADGPSPCAGFAGLDRDVSPGSGRGRFHGLIFLDELFHLLAGHSGRLFEIRSDGVLGEQVLDGVAGPSRSEPGPPGRGRRGGVLRFDGTGADGLLLSGAASPVRPGPCTPPPPIGRPARRPPAAAPVRACRSPDRPAATIAGRRLARTTARRPAARTSGRPAARLLPAFLALRTLALRLRCLHGHHQRVTIPPWPTCPQPTGFLVRHARFHRTCCEPLPSCSPRPRMNVPRIPVLGGGSGLAFLAGLLRRRSLRGILLPASGRSWRIDSYQTG